MKTFAKLKPETFPSALGMTEIGPVGSDDLPPQTGRGQGAGGKRRQVFRVRSTIAKRRFPISRYQPEPRGDGPCLPPG